MRRGRAEIAAEQQERRVSAGEKARALPMLWRSLERGPRDVAPPSVGTSWGTVAVGLSCLALLAAWPARRA